MKGKNERGEKKERRGGKKERGEKERGKKKEKERKKSATAGLEPATFVLLCKLGCISELEVMKFSPDELLYMVVASEVGFDHVCIKQVVIIMSSVFDH